MTGAAVRMSLLLAALGALPALSLAQVPSPPETQPAPRFKSSIDVVSVAAVVRDKKGRFVSDLSKEDFKIVEGGVLRKILDFRAEANGPVKMALLVDISGSMRVGGLAVDAQQMAKHLFAALRPIDQSAIFTFDTGSEYWDKGRLGALRHASIDGTEDLPDASNVRVYYVAGSRHGSGSVPASDGGGQFKNNTLDYDWAQRGLMAALDAWVREGKEPPPSRHPKLADGTMVPHSRLKFPAVPGVQWPTQVPGGYRWDVDTPLSPLPFLLSQVDVDGNEIGGIRLPEQEVPLGTMTGWQFRSERIGAPHTLIVNSGAYIPFPVTRAEREKTGDPRLSIEERYANRADYLAKVTKVANALAKERYVLQRDVSAMIEAAGKHWDWRMTDSQSQQSSKR